MIPGVERSPGEGNNNPLQFSCLKNGGSGTQKPPANAGDADVIPESGRSPGEGSGSPLQYSCLRNPMDRGAWWAIVHGVAESNVVRKLKQQ